MSTLKVTTIIPDSGEDNQVKAIAETIWTDEVKTKWKQVVEENSI